VADVTFSTTAILGTNGESIDGICGATIALLDAVYYDTSTGTWKLADADALATAPASTTAPTGLALNAGVANMRLRVAVGGELTVTGTTLVVGETYVVSTAVGKVAPIADLASGDFAVILGIAKTATVLHLKPFGIGIAKA
jgi:hypothetical protein